MVKYAKETSGKMKQLNLWGTFFSRFSVRGGLKLCVFEIIDNRSLMSNSFLLLLFVIIIF